MDHSLPISSKGFIVPRPPEVADIKKRRASRACVNCNKAHVSCEDARPCKRCVEKGLSHLCKDVDNGKRRGRKGTYLFDSYAPPSAVVINEAKVITPVPPTPSPPMTPYVMTSPEQLPMLDLPADLQSFLSDFFVADPDPTESWSPETSRDVQQFLSVLTSRVPEYKETLLTRFAATRDKMDKYLKECHKVDTKNSDMKKIVESTKNEVQLWTRKYEQMFENLATPFFVYDRSGSIRYVNPAYRGLTGFNLELPTPISEYSFYVHILSPFGIRQYLDIMLNFMENFTSMLSSSGFMFKAGVKVFDESSNVEKEIIGTMVVNFKRDQMDLPFLWLGSFMPSEVTKVMTFQPHHL